MKPLLTTYYLHFLCYFLSMQDHFVSLFCFPNIIMYIPNIASAIRMMTVNELRDFIFENSYYSMKHQKKKY